ncbi:DNA damage-inducible protein DinB [Syncephalis fuscata]|nr:DNA damage-inducible protein DinB [Syncephalis fuscata]
MATAALWKQHFLHLARYNAWAYQVLLKSTSALNDEQFSAHVGLCFRSIHGTFNHLIASDTLWYSRLAQKTNDECIEARKMWSSEEKFAKADDAFSIWEQYITDRNQIADFINQSSVRYIEFIESLPDSYDFESPFPYTDSSKMPRATNWRIALTHVFNHATHHRGQISGGVTQLGLAPPSIDLIFYPGSTWAPENKNQQ